MNVQKKCRRIESFAEILKSELPSLALIKRRFGEDFIQAYIEGWIINLREFVNVGKKMTDEQTQETAMLIVQEYYNLNISDINFIFKNAKLGRYGKIYDRLDGQLILEWFDKHFAQRCTEAANISMNEYDNSDNHERSSRQIEIKNLITKSKVEYEKTKFRNIT